MKATMPRAIDAAAWKSQDFSNTLLEVFWLLRGLTPDLKTIADFRKDNRGAFKLVFRQFVLLCRKLELFGGGRFEASALMLRIARESRNSPRSSGDQNSLSPAVIQ